MGSMFGLFQLSALALVTLTVFASAVSGGLYVALRPHVMRLAPSSRARLIVAWCAAPAVVGAALTALCFVPSLAALAVGGSADHCIAHPDHHGHLCLLHPPHGAGSALLWIALGCVALLTAGRLVRRVVVLRAANRALRSLRQCPQSEATATGGVQWMSSARPLALTVGLFRPQVLVSSVLRARLEPRLLSAVLEHEEAHRRRRDVLWKAVATLVGSLHWPGVGRRLLEDLHLACEQAADAEAAVALDDPVLVAEAILAVERLTADSPPFALWAGASFGGPCVTARVHALLDAKDGGTLRLGPWIAGTCIVGLLVSEPFHHAVETVLALLAR